MPRLTTKEQVQARGTAPDTGLTEADVQAYQNAQAELRRLPARQRELAGAARSIAS